MKLSGQQKKNRFLQVSIRNTSVEYNVTSNKVIGVVSVKYHKISINYFITQKIIFDIVVISKSRALAHLQTDTNTNIRMLKFRLNAMSFCFGNSSLKHVFTKRSF